MKRLLSVFLFSLMIVCKGYGQDPTPSITFPGITLVPQLSVTKSGQKALHDMGLPARASDAVFVFVQYRDPEAQAYSVTVKYSYLGVTYTFTQVIPVTGTPDQSSQAVAIFDIPSMDVQLLGVGVEIAQAITTRPALRSSGADRR